MGGVYELSPSWGMQKAHDKCGQGKEAGINASEATNIDGTSSHRIQIDHIGGYSGR